MIVVPDPEKRSPGETTSFEGANLSLAFHARDALVIDLIKMNNHRMTDILSETESNSCGNFFPLRGDHFTL